MAINLNGIGPGSIDSRSGADKSGKTAPKGEQATPASRPEQTPVKGEQVNLSDQSKELKKLEQSLSEMPEIDDAKVDQIRKSLADGSYKIDANALAQKMLDMDQSIFG